MNAMREKTTHFVRRLLWMSLAWAVPTVVVTAIAIGWLGYCFVIPFIVVEVNVNPALAVPEGAVCGPWEADPSSGIERRRCELDWPFAHFTIVEPRDAGKARKEVWGDPKWVAIVLATLLGILVYSLAWIMWLRLLRRATPNLLPH